MEQILLKFLLNFPTSLQTPPCSDAGPVRRSRARGAVSAGEIWHACIAIRPAFIEHSSTFSNNFLKISLNFRNFPIFEKIIATLLIVRNFHYFKKAQSVHLCSGPFIIFFFEVHVLLFKNICAKKKKKRFLKIIFTVRS